MSLNLLYVKEDSCGISVEDFEFQTPTILTEKVIEAKTIEEQIDIIEEFIESEYYTFTKEKRKDIMENVRHKISNGWELSYV